MNLYDDSKTVRELYAAYHTIVKGDVTDAIGNAVTAYRESCDEGEENDIDAAIESERDAIEEYLNEQADSFVTYTTDARTILFVSENEYAAENELGEEEAKALTVGQRAYYAYMADARTWLDNSYFIADIGEELATSAKAG